MSESKLAIALVPKLINAPAGVNNRCLAQPAIRKIVLKNDSATNFRVTDGKLAYQLLVRSINDNLVSLG